MTTQPSHGIESRPHDAGVAPDSVTSKRERFRPKDLASLALLFTAACGVTVLLTLAATPVLINYPQLFSDPLFMDRLFFGSGYITPDGWPSIGLAVLMATVLLGLPLGMTVLAWLLGVRKTRWSIVALLIMAPVFVYLAKDDAETPYAFSLEEISPVKPGMAESYAVLMQWGSGTETISRLEGSPAAAKLTSPRNKVPAISDAGWPLWVRDNQDLLTEVDRELPELRTWWETWSAFPEVGDLATSFKDPILSYRPVRLYARMVCAEATRLALEGRGDAAITALLPLARGAAKLQTSSRTLVRSMIAFVLREMAIDTAGLVLRETSVSPAARASLAEAVAAGQGGERLARRLVAVEFAQAYDILRQGNDKERITGGPLGWWLGPVVLNRNRTFNEMSIFMLELQERVARRDIEGAEETCARFNRELHAVWSIKNVAGRIIEIGYAPAFSKVARSYWRIEDKGAALIARLRGEPAPATGATPSTQNPEAGK